eukprot:gene24799-26719_t
MPGQSGSWERTVGACRFRQRAPLRRRGILAQKPARLQLAPELTKRLGNQVLLKREDNQPVFSFKLRGAYNKMAHLPPEALKRGVITASAGNHAQ